MYQLFVPYELAVKLKEKGFNESCFGGYYLFENKPDLCIYQDENEFSDSKEIILQAPLYQQAIDFIISKEVFVGVSDFPIYNGKYGYRYGRGMTSGGYTPHFEGTTRYEAFAEAMKQALELIKNK